MTHTSGPWRIISERADELKVKGAGDEWVADCADGFWSDEQDGWIMACEAEANARLIAAAPDLLEALKECAVLIAQNCNRRLTFDEQRAIDNARAVIAKVSA